MPPKEPQPVSNRFKMSEVPVASVSDVFVVNGFFLFPHWK